MTEAAGNSRRRFAGKVRRKRDPKLRRWICGATNGGSKKGLYFWNQRVEGYAGIYIGLGFGKVSEFLNFGILNKSFSVPK
jgi:hypothetical protein